VERFMALWRAHDARLNYRGTDLAAGQKPAAIKAFGEVKTPEKDAMVAHLWSLAARR
jgi:hypothetical protein